MTYTPSTTTIRQAYHYAAGTEATGLQTYEEVDAEFELWLLQHNREVAAQALRRAAEDAGEAAWWLDVRADNTLKGLHD